MPVCVCVSSICSMSLSHMHTYTSSFLVFFPFYRRGFGMSLSTSSCLGRSRVQLWLFISLIRSIHLFFSRPRGHHPSGLKRNAQHTHTQKVFDLTLSLPSLGCCVFSCHFSSSLTFLSSVGVCACFPPLSLSLSLSLPYGQNTLNTQLCRSIWQLNNCSPYMLRMSSVTSSVWETGSENFS